MRVRTVRALSRALGVAVLFVFGIPAIAAVPLVISPTVVEIQPGRRSAVIQIENASDRAVDLQFRAYDWDQVDGRDALKATASLAISPTIVTLPARGKQIFRLLDLAPPAGHEKGFRLRLNELPDRDSPKGIDVNLEFSIPVFAPVTDGAARLAWRLDRGRLVLRNDGTRRVRLGTLTATVAGGRTIPLAITDSPYLLAGRSRSWPLSPSDTAVRVHYETDHGTGDADVPMASAS